jgi:entericidin A
MEKIVRRMVLLSVLAAVIGGCNTTAGLGKDLQKLGGKIEQKAEQKK